MLVNGTQGFLVQSWKIHVLETGWSGFAGSHADVCKWSSTAWCLYTLKLNSSWHHRKRVFLKLEHMGAGQTTSREFACQDLGNRKTTTP